VNALINALFERSKNNLAIGIAKQYSETPDQSVLTMYTKVYNFSQRIGQQ